MPALSKEQKICLAIWRKALLSPETFILKIPSKSTAQTIKRTLYKVIQPYREETLFDTDLSEAAQTLVPKVNEVSGEWHITFHPRQTLVDLTPQLEALGISELDLLSPEERAAQESLQKLMPAKPTSTPFYTRED